MSACTVSETWVRRGPELVQTKAALGFTLSWLRKRRLTSYWCQDRKELAVALPVIREGKPRFELGWQKDGKRT